MYLCGFRHNPPYPPRLNLEKFPYFTSYTHTALWFSAHLTFFSSSLDVDSACDLWRRCRFTFDAAAMFLSSSGLAGLLTVGTMTLVAVLPAAAGVSAGAGMGFWMITSSRKDCEAPGSVKEESLTLTGMPHSPSETFCQCVSFKPRI